jgi:Mg2+ and Co2+ transporter CorA
MPELRWLLGYPMALILMLVVAVGPILYLRKKRML